MVECGVVVEHEDGVNSLDEYSKLCPGRVEVGNKNGRAFLKTLDGGNTRLDAFEDQLIFRDVNNQDGVTLAELVACCDTDSNGSGSVYDPIAVNFPSAGVFTYQHSGRAKSAYWDELTDPFDPNWNDRDLYNIFDKANNSQVVELPPGANAAVVLGHYEVAARPWSGVVNTGTGYVNVGYDWEMSTNKGSVTYSPGVLAAGVRIFGEILGWNDGASSIGGGDETLRKQRTPSHTGTGMRVTRIRFDESTADSPTRLNVVPSCTIHRVRGCEVSVGSGRVLILPYNDDGTNWTPISGFSMDGDYDLAYFDDSAVEKAFDERLESVELKDRMNYMSNAIRETLDYDEGLDPDGIPILQQALKDIFNLKREDYDDYEYYENRLETIKTVVLPYVGFVFGFEKNNTVRSF